MDTIAAIATAMGEASLSVIRISGPEAFAIADRCFHPLGFHSKSPLNAESHSVHYGKILQKGAPIDEVLLTIFRAPRSFTREDIVEISCHGGLIPAQRILETLICAGARLAEPGEFTKRAFLNGRIDLAQAEAVSEVIAAKTDLALRAAHAQLAGVFSKRIEILREDLIGLLAHIEAHIDFPDEDISPDSKKFLIEKLKRNLAQMRAMIASAREGQILRNGIRTAIIGRPNAGKSSLLNCLLGRERAIVSDISGTTRDTIEELADIRGVPVIFIDTAGIRHSKNPIEQEGIRRSEESIERAELILHVIDATKRIDGIDEFEDSLLTKTNKTIIRLFNKSDLILENRATFPQNISANSLAISCRTGAGLDALRTQIASLLWNGKVGKENMEMAISTRHKDALKRAQSAAQITLQSLCQDLSLELVAIDLRIATNAIGEIVGKTTTEDLLDKIFSQFCLGK